MDKLFCYCCLDFVKIYKIIILIFNVRLFRLFYRFIQDILFVSFFYMNEKVVGLDWFMDD